MKRDMELIRLILLALEGDEAASERSRSEYDSATIAYHAALMIEAGLVEGVVANDEKGIPARCVIQRMTWSGHDFLDAMRDETIWKKARESVLKPIGGVAFDVLKEWLKAQMREKLGLPASD
jgi:hypothetical protein